LPATMEAAACCLPPHRLRVPVASACPAPGPGQGGRYLGAAQPGGTGEGGEGWGAGDGGGSGWICVKAVRLPAVMGTPLIVVATVGGEGAEPGEQCWGLPGCWSRARSTEAVRVQLHVPSTPATHPGRG